MKKEAEANAETDRIAKEKVDKLNGADSMIFQTEKQLKEFGEKLGDKKAAIETALEELKKAHSSQDIAAIDAAMEQINEAWKHASEEMYKAQQDAPAGEAGAPEGADDTSNAGDDVTDVEYEEVK
jgi:molecular chaperone DnaK